jgi:hypothetical protein
MRIVTSPGECVSGLLNGYLANSRRATGRRDRAIQILANAPRRRKLALHRIYPSPLRRALPDVPLCRIEAGRLKSFICRRPVARGTRGPAITPGDARRSLLYKLVAHEQEPAMPYKATKLSRVYSWRTAAWDLLVLSWAPCSSAMALSELTLTRIGHRPMGSPTSRPKPRTSSGFSCLAA